jgi:malonyl-CoA O-methyltransferase
MTMNILACNMPEHDNAPPPLDALAARRWQQLALRQALSDSAPWLHEEVGSRMAQRLDWIKRAPENWVNWRALPSGAAAHAAIQQKYPKSKPFMAPAVIESAQSAHKLIAKQGVLKGWLGKLSGQATAMLQPWKMAWRKWFGRT